MDLERSVSTERVESENGSALGLESEDGPGNGRAVGVESEAPDRLNGSALGIEPANGSAEAGFRTGTASVLAEPRASAIRIPLHWRRRARSGIDEEDVGRALGALSNVVHRRDSVYRRSLATADVLAVVATLLIATRLVGGDRELARVVITVIAVPLMVVMGKLTGLYDRQESLLRKSALDEAPMLFQLTTLYVVILWMLQGTLVSGVSDRRGLVMLWIALFPTLLLFRWAARWFSRLVTPAERCLVVGERSICDRIRTKLATRPGLHASVVVYVPLDALRNVRAQFEKQGTELLAYRGDLRALAAKYRIDRIIIAPDSTDLEHVMAITAVATAVGVKVSVVPRILEVIGSAAEFDDIESIPLLTMRHMQLSWSSRMVKRALDVLVSVSLLVLLAPIWVIVAIAIRLDSRGPILFRQARIGRDGKPFEMFKFRTMVEGAHELREQLRHLNEADGLFKIKRDPRITRVGRTLRRLSLDEIPQLWNVVRGDMSLVGPRPLIAEEDRHIQGCHRRRLQLTPGMTGHWQILGSARIPLDEMAQIDYLYVINWSLWNDIKILLRTIPYVAARHGM